jgi:hypothetical protein
MTMQFINDDFLPQMFYEGTNSFKEIKAEGHWIEGVGSTIALLGNERKEKYLVAVYGSEVVGIENEGIYYFDDLEEAEQLYQALLREHYSSDEDSEFKADDGQSDLSI